MARHDYSSVLIKGWSTIVLFGLLGLILALLISFVQPLKYSSTVRLLVRQDARTSVDAYTQARSDEQIADNMTDLIFTTSFFDQVLSAGFEIDDSTFPPEDHKRRRAWRKTVSATVTRGSGLMTVSAFHQNPVQAERIVRAVAFVLGENPAEFASVPNVTVRLVDAPLNSRWPVRPNIPVNGFSGLVLGALVGVLYLIVQTERLRRRHQLVHEDFG